MTETMVVNAPQSEAEEIESLSGMNIGELRVIADAIGATNARAKTDLATNIVARAREQGITYSGYMGALAGVAAQAPTELEEELAAEQAAEQPAGQPENGKPPEPLAQTGEQAWFDPYMLDIKHLLFWVSDANEPDVMGGVYDVYSADAEISRYLANGFEPAECFVAGFDTRGHRLGWVLRKTDGGLYAEAKHVVRTLTSNPDPARGTITGFQADAYISSLIRDGWTLVAARINGVDAAPGGGVGGFFMVWFLVR